MDVYYLTVFYQNDVTSDLILFVTVMNRKYYFIIYLYICFHIHALKKEEIGILKYLIGLNVYIDPFTNVAPLRVSALGRAGDGSTR